MDAFRHLYLKFCPFSFLTNAKGDIVRKLGAISILRLCARKFSLASTSRGQDAHSNFQPKEGFSEERIAVIHAPGWHGIDFYTESMGYNRSLERQILIKGGFALKQRARIR